MKSECFAGASVQFPEFTGERVYMREFIPRNGLPKDLERWQPTIDAMLVGVNAPGSVYLMIDQAEVKAGNYHRRPGLHVDGYWYASGHAPIPRHNPIPSPKFPLHPPAHHPTPANPEHHSTLRHSMVGSSEAIILASNVEGCEAFNGEWDGIAGSGGDCSAITTNGLKQIRMRADVTWLGETGVMLHSSLALSANALRTVVRLNVPGWYPN